MIAQTISIRMKSRALLKTELELRLLQEISLLLRLRALLLTAVVVRFLVCFMQTRTVLNNQLNNTSNHQDQATKKH